MEIRTARAIRNLTRLQQSLKKLENDTDNLSKKLDSLGSKRIDIEVRGASSAILQLEAVREMAASIPNVIRIRIDVDRRGIEDLISALNRLDGSNRRILGSTNAASSGMRFMGMSAANLAMLIGTLVTLAAPAIIALTGAVLALVGAFATMIPAVGAFAAVAGPLFKDLFEGTKAIMSAKKGTEEYSKAIDDLAEKFGVHRNLAEQMAERLHSLKGRYTALQDAIKPHVFGTWNNMIGVADTLLAKLAPSVESMAVAVRNLSGRMNEALQGDRWQKFFDLVNKRGAEWFEDWMRGFGNIIEGLAQLAVALEPLTDAFSKGFRRMTQDFENWAVAMQDSDGFRKFMEDVQKYGPQVLDTLGSLLKLLWNITDALAPLGDALMKIIDALADLANAWHDADPGSFDLAIQSVVLALAGLWVLSKIIKLIKGFTNAIGGSTRALNKEIAADKKKKAALGGVGGAAAGTTGKMGRFTAAIKRSALAAGVFAGLMTGRALGALGRFGGAIGRLGSSLGTKLSGPLSRTGGLLTRFGPKVLKGAGLVGAAVAIWDAAGWALEKLGFKVTRVGDVFGLVKDIFTGDWQGVMDYWKGVLEDFIHNWQLVWDKLSAFGEWLGSVFVTMWQGIANFLSEVWNTILLTAQAIWTLIQTFFQTVWDTIKNIVMFAVDFIKNVIETAWNVISTITQTIWNIIQSVIQTVWNIIQTIIQTALDFITNLITTAWNVIQNITQAAWNTIQNIIQTIVSTIQNLISSFISTAQNVLSAGWNAITNLTQQAWNQMVQAVTYGANTIASIASGLPSRIVNALGDLSNLLFGAGQAVMQGFIDGIQSMMGALGDVAGGIGGFVSGLKGPIPKDLILLIPHGKAVMQGFMDGIKSRLPDLKGLLGNITNAIPAEVQNKVKGLWDRLQTFIQSYQAASDKGSFIYDTLKGIDPRLAAAWEAYSGKDYSPDDPSSGGGTGGGSTGGDTNIDVVINNPVAEPSSESVQKYLSRMAALGMFS